MTEINRTKKAIIIGAGPAGLTAAFELLKRGIAVTILEANNRYVGGISRTEEYHGNHLDIGGHRFFSKSETVMKWWESFMPPEDQSGEGARMLIRSRLSRIFFNRTFFPYPISLNYATFKKLGVKKIIKIGFSYLAAQIHKQPENSLEEFFINRFGRELYRTFFKDYTEKVWGVPCSQIPADWGAQRVKGLSLSKALLNAVAMIFRKKNLQQKTVETSLIDRFLYPPKGPGQFWTMVAEKIKNLGGEILMGQTVTAIEQKNGRIEALTAIDQTGQKHRYTADYFFSTMAIKDLALAFNEMPAEIKNIAVNLQYRDFITVGLLVNELNNREPAPIRDNWIYIQEPDVKVGRLQIFNNWSPEMTADSKSIWLGLEYFANEGDALWNQSNEAMIKQAEEEIIKIGLLKPGQVKDATVVRVPKAYPSYFGAYKNLNRVQNFFDSIPNLFLIGRNGTHHYNNSDHSMLTAIAAVDCALDGTVKKEDIWKINTEKDYHEEKNDKPRYNFFKKYYPEIIALAIFSTISILWLFKHEPWLDEAQAFLIARDAGGVLAMAKIMGYEGSPMLWHLILYVLIKLGGGYFAMHVLHAGLAIAAAGVWLWFCPLPRAYKIPVIFGYYFIYEYNAIARSYVLDVLFLFLIAIFYQKQQKHPIIFSLLLIALSQINIHGAMIAGIIFIFYLWEIIKKQIETKTTDKKAIISVGLIIISYILIFAQVKINSDTDINLPWLQVATPTQPLVAVLAAFSPVPLLQNQFWGINALLNYWLLNPINQPNNWYVYALILVIFGSFFFLMSLYIIWDNPRIRLIYLGIILSLSLVFLILHGGANRHYGLIWISFLFVLWCYCQNGGELNRAAHIFLILTITLQLIGGLIAGYYDIKYDFSTAYQTAEYLNKNNFLKNNNEVVAFRANAAAALAPYLPGQLIQYYEYNKKMSYVVWNKQFGDTVTEEPEILLEKIISTLDAKKSADVENIYFLSNLPTFHSALSKKYQLLKYFGPSIVKEESFYLYQIK